MRLIGYLFSAALAVILSAAPAWAEEAGHASDGALPQFRTEFFAGELFWLAISFTALYLLMKHVALPKVAVVQDARALQRQTDLAAAATANDAAKHAITAYEKTLADARAQAQGKLSQMIAQAQQEATATAQKQQRDLDARMAEAQAKIDANLQQALAHVRETAVAATSEILHRLTGTEDAGAAAHAVDKVSQHQRSAA